MASGARELKERAKHLNAALSNLERLSHQRLVALRNACDGVSQTNCWWAVYELAPLLRRSINNEFARRVRARAKRISANSTGQRT